MIPIQVAAAIPVHLGIVELDHVSVRETNAELAANLETACATIQGTFKSTDLLSSDPTVQAVRAFYRATGSDPTRYRPASEALLRRVVRGEGLPRINTAVDVNNWCSVEWRLPLGLYNRDQIQGAVHLRLGQPGEVYSSIGRGNLDAGGRLALADDLGLFGSPTSDSARTQVDLNAQNLLLVIFAPSSFDPATLAAFLDRGGTRLATYNGGQVTRTEVIASLHSQ